MRFASLTAAMLCLSACGSGSTRSAEPPSDVPSPPRRAAEGEGSDTAAARPTSDDDLQAIAPGATCEADEEDITPMRAFERRGDVISRDEAWGCGCPERPELILRYEAESSPLRLRLCHEDGADPCEMLCRRTVRWDLSTLLEREGETEVIMVGAPPPAD